MSDKYELITIDAEVKPDKEIEYLVADIMKPFQHLKEETAGRTEMFWAKQLRTFKTRRKVLFV